MFYCLLALLSVVTAAPTQVHLVKSEIQVDGVKYPRLRMEGSGPLWRTVGGIGGLWIHHEDEHFDVAYFNHLDGPSIVHAHGLRPDLAYDGVPYISASPIDAGHSAHYFYNLRGMDGTYFVHSHFSFQHEQGLAAPAVIMKTPPRDYPNGGRIANATEAVMFLEDFCPYLRDEGPDMNPTCFDSMPVYNSLKKDFEEGLPDFNFSNCMDPIDEVDILYRTHLANGKQSSGPSVMGVSPGEDVRLRVIDASATTTYQLDFGDLEATLIAVDGQYVEPQRVESFYLGVAQRADFVFTIPADGGTSTYPVFANTVDTGTGQRAVVVFALHDSPAPTYDTSGGPVLFQTDEFVVQEMGLKAWFPLPDREVDVVFDIKLTGDDGFMSMNKATYQLPPLVSPPLPANPNALVVSEGQRVCIEMENFNGDPHPMHLHGHSFQVVSIEGTPINGAVRDTLQTPKGQCSTMVFCFDADHPGVWPFHCHMAFHLSAGMLTTVEYSDQ